MGGGQEPGSGTAESGLRTLSEGPSGSFGCLPSGRRPPGGKIIGNGRRQGRQAGKAGQGKGLEALIYRVADSLGPGTGRDGPPTKEETLCVLLYQGKQAQEGAGQLCLTTSKSCSEAAHLVVPCCQLLLGAGGA